jgi:hypothetical protein
MNPLQTISYPVVLCPADRAFTGKFLSQVNDPHMQDLLLQYYPAGLPPGYVSWAELLYNVLSS